MFENQICLKRNGTNKRDLRFTFGKDKNYRMLLSRICGNSSIGKFEVTKDMRLMLTPKNGEKRFYKIVYLSDTELVLE